MTSSGELIRIALLALLTGVAVPLLVQLFLTLRSLRLATDAVERRLDKLLGDVNAIAEQVRTRAAHPSPLAASLTAALPAVFAAVQAFRTSMQADAPAAAEGEAAFSKHRDEHRDEAREKERSHEQRKM
jgi:uncharacterized protein YoxC